MTDPVSKPNRPSCVQRSSKPSLVQPELIRWCRKSNMEEGLVTTDLGIDPVKSSADTITTAHTSSEDGESSSSLSRSVEQQQQPGGISRSCSATQTKKVHFDIDKKRDKVVSSVLGTSLSQDMPAVWFSPKEMQTMYQHAYAVVDFFSKHRADYTQAVRSMITQCAQTGSSLHCLRTASVLPDIVGSSARGLESYAVEMMRHRREWTGKQLLSKQRLLKQQGISVEQRCHILALQYSRNSIYASLWAQVLADCDSLVVADTLSSSRSIILSQSCHHF